MISLSLLLAFSAAAVAADAPAANADQPAAVSASADAAPAATAAATPNADELDKAAEERVKSIEECVDTLNYFRQNLKDKQASLDKEFKGQVPSAFSNLLNLKRNRITKQQDACSKLVSGGDAPIDASMASARLMDGSSSAYAARRKKLDALRARLNAALKLFFARPN